MRQKYTRLAIVFLMLLQMFIPSFSQVYAEKKDSNKQPEVCAWPSETMQQYFQFQKDALKAISLSTASNRNISVWNSNWWIFTKKDLNLPSSALDYVVGNLWWKTSSVVSTTATSVALLLLASSSVIESDVEWLAILFKDRPIVRDYKKMLDIETEIFETAFSFSKKVDLTRTLEWNTLKQLDSVIKQYQSSWLLRKWLDANSSASMANILSDLISMNASMKFFISMWWEAGASELRSYAWCLSQSKWDECSETNFVLWFSEDAVSKLKEEYSGTWWYWACNSYGANFKNSLSKSAKNNWDTIRNAWDSMKVSWRNLINALIWKWTWSKTLTDPCEMTDYERAQLDAYYWWDWNCWEWVSVSSLLAGIKEYEKNKKTLLWQWGENTDLTKQSASSEPPSVLDVINQLNKKNNTADREVVWYRIYSGESVYNPEFSNDMNSEFTVIFNDVQEQYWHSQRAAMASDLTFELSKFKWLVEQISTAMKAAWELKDDLQAIVDYQCSM